MKNFKLILMISKIIIVYIALSILSIIDNDKVLFGIGIMLTEYWQFIDFREH